MATIPRIVAQRSLDPGGVVQYPTGDPVGAALEQGANKFQQLTLHYQDRVNQQERFQALIGFDGLGSELAGETQKATQTMQPGAMGLHDTLLETYDKRSQEWLSSIPESQRPEFEARIKAKREAFSLGAAKLEKAESDRFQLSSIDTRLGTAKNGILQSGPDAVAPFQRDVEELIDSSTLSPVQKAEAKKKVQADLAETGFRSLAVKDPKAAQSVAAGWGIGGGVDAVVNKIVGVESGGNDNATNPNSSAAGAGQFINSTWLATVRKYRPDLMQGRSEAEVLALRSNGALSREMTKNLAQENAATLSAAGITPTAGNVYLAHFLGADGARKVLSADPATPVAQIVGQGAVDANRSVLAGKNAGEVAAWAATKMGAENKPVAIASADPRFAAIPADRRLVLAGAADLEVRRQTAELAAADAKVYADRLNALQTDIIDGKATMADVAKARQDGWLKDAGDIRQVSNQITARDKGLADTENFGRAITDPNFPWNPVDKDQKDWADAGFKSLGGNMQALQTIAEKTGIVPASAAVAMRGALSSPNPQRVENALQTAANLVGGKYPDIFAGADGGKDLTDAGLTFREYVYGRGMTAADATKKIMEERTPEFERNVKAKIKKEDVDQIVKKNLTDGDIRSAFDPSFLGLAPNPQLAFDPAMRQRAMGDYETAFRDNFMRNGDVNLSKTLALAEMKRTWGVTEVNGSKTVMKYPPERSPAYAGIANPSEHIAMQAVAAIKDLNGADVDRSKIRLDEVKTTGERFIKGQPPTYVLSYVDKNGHVQVIPKQFYADPAAMRDAQTAARAAESARIQTRVAIDADNSDLNRANFGVRP